MKLEVCKDENEWVACANDWLSENGRAFAVHSSVPHLPGSHPSGQPVRLFVPAGETPRPLYRSWRENPKLVDEKTVFVQVDEILERKTGSGETFQKFFLQELPAFSKRFEFISDAEKGADLAFLGLGMNGHVAFHEPGLAREFYSGCLTLNRPTCENLHRPEGTRAVSYGVSAFLKTRAIALLVRGLQKEEVLKKVLSSQELPASWLLDHPQLTIITTAFLGLG